MERLEVLLYWIDGTLETRKRRHIVGGILMSVSFLFCGLAATVMIINKEEKRINDE